MWLGEEKKKKQCPYRLRKPSLRIRQADRYVNICEAILGGMLDYNLSWNKHYQPQKISSQWLLWLFSTDRCNFWFVRSDWEPLNCREQLLWQRACWTISSLSAKRVNRHRVGLHAVTSFSAKMFYHPALNEGSSWFIFDIIIQAHCWGYIGSCAGLWTVVHPLSPPICTVMVLYWFAGTNAGGYTLDKLPVLHSTT